ncbi:MAG: response regulator [Planctomycetota bacterium]|nr:response regulator [Planctomycetota bacterium]
MKVLVIDDSRAMRMILKTTLRELGHEVSEASNGQEGLDVLKSSGPFALALVDWNIPLVNGYEFVCKVRADPAYAAMKMVMVTTEVETSQVAKALGAGANEYVMKPFTKDILRDKIEMLAAA